MYLSVFDSHTQRQTHGHSQRDSQKDRKNDSVCVSISKLHIEVFYTETLFCSNDSMHEHQMFVPNLLTHVLVIARVYKTILQLLLCRIAFLKPVVRLLDNHRAWLPALAN